VIAKVNQDPWIQSCADPGGCGCLANVADASNAEIWRKFEKTSGFRCFRKREVDDQW
jgi:hypothetical protein